MEHATLQRHRTLVLTQMTHSHASRTRVSSHPYLAETIPAFGQDTPLRYEQVQCRTQIIVSIYMACNDLFNDRSAYRRGAYECFPQLDWFQLDGPCSRSCALRTFLLFGSCTLPSDSVWTLRGTLDQRCRASNTRILTSSQLVCVLQQYTHFLDTSDRRPESWFCTLESLKANQRRHHAHCWFDYLVVVISIGPTYLGL